MASKGKHAPLALTACLLVGIGWSSVNTDTQDTLSGLEGAFEIGGGLLEDRNGDGHVDFISARIVLGSNPSSGEVIAAANIAARWGFETESMNLRLLEAESGFPVAVGGSGMARLGVEPDVLDVDLEPGIGLVAYVERPNGPAIVVVGGDEEGLKAASLAFGGRAPFLWASDGPTFADVVERIRDVLDAEGVASPEVAVRNAILDQSSGMRRLDVLVNADVGNVELATSVLRRVGEQAQTTGRGDSAAQDSTVENSLHFDGLRLLKVDVVSSDRRETVYIQNPDNPVALSGRRPGAGNKGDLSLSNLFSNDGFLGDGDSDLIPDRVDVVLSPDGVQSPVVDLASRIALESTGITYPMVVAAADIQDPRDYPPLVLIGANHPLVRELVDSGKVTLPELLAGDGWVQVVPKAFGEKSAVVVTGGDSAGVARVLRQLAEHTPNINVRGKDRPTLRDVDEELRRALSGRSPVGQAAMAVYKLDQILSELDSAGATDAQVEVFVEKAAEGLEDFLSARYADRFGPAGLSVAVADLDVQNARVIFDEEITIPSEVDAFWELFYESVLPAVESGLPVHIDVRLSESPEIRQQISDSVISEITRAGADLSTSSVRIISAYKQGFSWMSEFVSPELARIGADEVVIRFAEVGAPENWPQQAMFTPTRWLLEAFPIDEILARDLDLDLSRIRFEIGPVGSVAYRVLGMRDDETVFDESFHPAIHLRPYFERFPDYEMARVTTGWLTGVVAADTIVNTRIVTDLERFWDHFQSQTLMRIYDHVMAVSEGGPRASDAPHFGELTVDVSLSEPDFPLGIDQEQIASMEALHEEIYFGVLHFFDVLGRMARGQDLSYPGRVIPIVRPRQDGRPGRARITFTGFDAPGPSVKVTSVTDGRTSVRRRDLLPLPLEAPKPMTGWVRGTDPGWTQLGYTVPVDFDEDLRAEWILRTNTRSVDSRITTARQTTDVLRQIEALRSTGLYADALAYDGLGEVEIAAYWSHEFDADSQRTAILAPNGWPASIPQNIAEGYVWNGESLVQWDTPIAPPEAADILSRMATFPEATVYLAGRSYLGKDIWAMDLVEPVDGDFWSQAKATARKPTVIYSARQHANEVSSTSHVLKLAEHLLTDSAYADVLKSVNVVIHPITNPDGAQLAYDLYQITPNHMLHAGYLGSLGVDVAAGQGDDDPLYPETAVRPKLWETWLPDIFLNPHGYPSHEWVQLFSEYAGWIRSRVPSQRGWWGMRGWFMPGFGYVDSPDFPRHREAAFEIRDRITKNINALTEIRALNTRAYDRYRRYGFAFDSENFKLDFSDSVLIYTSLTGSSGGGGVMSNPRVTIWSGTTEAPDETASGDWLKLVASAGLAWDNALLFYLVDGDHEIERSEVTFADGVTFKIHRQRPPKAVEEGS